ncbi:hypothetical protein NVP1121O_106 [Vibrio phage 1.121.O._10N.286.46.C4]|nr:hypothetical protein NVP1121O_106 [Vibrio phage 1.121.O._10N.286.46.C4]
MVKSGLDSEKGWIDNNPQYYKSKEHQELVKRNIEIRYRAQAMINLLNRSLSA